MEIEQEEIRPLEIVSPTIVYQQDKAHIDVQISTAKAYPRNIGRATDNAIAIVTMDETIAQSCTYSVPRGGKTIKGESVHLARILAQVWGNLRIDSKVIDIDGKHVTSEAMCFDLETNLAVKQQVKRRITDRNGRTFNDDMITVTGAAANAVALRQAVFNVIPKGVVKRVYDAAMQKVTGDISDTNKLIAKRNQVFDGLKKAYSVTDEEILFAVGKSSIDHIDRDDLVSLIGIGTAIKDGDTTVESAFKGKKDTTVIKPDDKQVSDEKQNKRIMEHIAKSKTIEQLEKVKDSLVTDEQRDFYKLQMEKLTDQK